MDSVKDRKRWGGSCAQVNEWATILVSTSLSEKQLMLQDHNLAETGLFGAIYSSMSPQRRVVLFNQSKVLSVQALAN